MGTPNNIASGFLQSFIGAHQQFQDRADQEEKDKANKTLQLLMAMEPNVSPEYRDHIHKTIVDMINLPSGKKGSAQLHSMLQGLSQLAGGQGPDVQTQNNQFSGYQQATSDNLGIPSGPASNPVSLANSSPLAMSVPLNTGMSVAGGASVPLSQLGGMLQQGPLAGPTPLASLGGDLMEGEIPGQQPFSERSPLVTASSSLAAPQKPLFNTTDKAGFNVKGRIPLMEDPLQKQVKLQTALSDIKDAQDEARQNRKEEHDKAILDKKASLQSDRDKRQNEQAIKVLGLKNDASTNKKINERKAVLKAITPRTEGENDETYNNKLTALAGAALKQDIDTTSELHKAHTDLYKQQKLASETKLTQQQQRIDIYEKNINSLIGKRGEDSEVKLKIANVAYLKARKSTVMKQFDSINAEESKLNPGMFDSPAEYNAKVKELENNKSDFISQINSLDDDIQRVEQGGAPIAQQPQLKSGKAGAAGGGGGAKIFPAANLQDYANKLHGGDLAKAKAEIEGNGYTIK